MGLPYQHGQHICCAYTNESEQVASAARFLAEGLRSGERCAYVGCSEASLVQFRDALSALGIDCYAAAERGALIESRAENVYLNGGAFNCDVMLGLLNGAVERTLHDGYKGLRACGNMTWLLNNPPGAEQIVEYESRVTGLCGGISATLMCQYDRQRLPASLLDHALATHTSVTWKEFHRPNPFYEPTETAIGRKAGADADVKRKLTDLFPPATYHSRGYLRGRAQGYMRGKLTLSHILGSVRLAKSKGLTDAEINETLRPFRLTWDVEHDKVRLVVD
jgi:hypothetical protein